MGFLDGQAWLDEFHQILRFVQKPIIKTPVVINRKLFFWLLVIMGDEMAAP